MPGMRFPRRRRYEEHQREERRYEERRRRRGFNALWAFFWLILVIILLGLIFGGYRKGTPIHNGSMIRPGIAAGLSTLSISTLSSRG